MRAALDAVEAQPRKNKTAAAKALGYKSRSTFKYHYNQARIRLLGETPEKAAIQNSVSRPRRHLFIPDTQIKPGVPLDHIDWIGRALVDYKPDVIIVGGDWWDFPSLNSHSDPGSLALEGQRFQNDVDAGNHAFARLCAPMEAEQAKPRNKWFPEKHFIEGNHENRADRVAMADPKWMGHVGSNACQVRDFKWHRFLKVITIDGVNYCHYFQNQHSKHAIGGSALNRLNKIGGTFVQGHVQGFDYGTRVTSTGRMLHGVVSGSCYLHIEEYRGPQGSKHFNGVQVFNEVVNGNFCIMPLSLQYLCKRYTGRILTDYMRVKYPDGNWDHLEWN